MKSISILVFLVMLNFQTGAQETHMFAEEDEDYVSNLSKSIGTIELSLDTIYDGYYVIHGAGVAGNIGVFVGEDGVYLIDSQWSALSLRIREIVASITDKAISLIINTHFHFDHTNGNMDFGREGIPILAHEKARQRMQRRQVLHGFNSAVQNPYPSEGLPTMTFAQQMELYDRSETIELKYFPNAHTDGDIIVHFKEADIYHMGDVFVPYGIPVIDPDGGGNIYALIKAIDYTIAHSKSTSKFIPGHGKVCSKEDLITFSELLHLVLDSVEGSIASGRNIEEAILAAKGVIGKDVGGIDQDRFITLVYHMVENRNN